jgi:DNA-binding Lrp family transcriptional regulator
MNGANVVIDSETLIRNCRTYRGLHSKAVDVLRKANGKTGYQEIAASLQIHPTKASSLLKQAEKLGLAKKQGEFYKKIPGILGYVGVASKKVPGDLISETVDQINKRKRRPREIPTPLGKSFQEKVREMSEAYEWLYVTENVLRELIRNVLGGEGGWWEKNVNESIREEVKNLMENYRYDAEARKDELEFTHLGQLKEIIISKSNWSKFLPRLNEKDKNKFAAIIDKALPYRNSVAHSTQLSPKGFKKVEIRFQDILEMIHL